MGGVMASAVSQRTYEIGIRLALGASPTDVLKMVIRQGMIVAAIGVALGLGGVYVLTKYLESWMNIVTLRQMGLNGGFPTNTVNTRLPLPRSGDCHPPGRIR